jgi:choline kinase
VIGLILAAGTGSRLGGGKPKCLIPIGETTVLETAVANLAAVEVAVVVVVVGYRQEEIAGYVEGVLVPRYPGVTISYAENHRYAETNTARSVQIGLEACTWEPAPILFLNGDVVFDKAVLEEFVSSELAEKRTLTVFVDRKVCGDEEIKYITDDTGRLADIGKHIDPSLAEGEGIGINFLPAEVRDLFIARLALCADGDFFEKAIAAMAKDEFVSIFDIGENFAIEIDFPDDLEAARRWTLDLP